jgi:hypothetical protein
VTIAALVHCRECLLTVEVGMFAAISSRIGFLKLVDGLKRRQKESTQREQSQASSVEGGLKIDHLNV